jgi:Tocopherol cyclase
VPFEGYYWRFAGPGWSVAVIAGVCRDDRGTWAMITLAAQPGGVEHTAIAERAWIDPDGLGVDAPPYLRADADSLTVDLGPGLIARFDARRDWPRRPWGPLGPAHSLPWLGQYWAPHLLGARVAGTFGDRSLDGAQVYAEKNWGAAFASHWWWGQAGFEGGAGVAFAGGRVHGVAPTAVAAWTPDGVVSLAPPFARTIARAGGGEWRIRASSARWRIELEGEAREPPLLLAVPLPAERRLEVRSNHHLLGRLAVRVHRGRRLWLAGESLAAGLEDGATPRAS